MKYYINNTPVSESEWYGFVRIMDDKVEIGNKKNIEVTEEQMTLF